MHAAKTLCRLLTLILLIPISVSASSAAKPKAESQALQRQAQDALAKGVRWLKRQQRADGSWRSKAYPGLESGVGSTSLIFATCIELRATQLVPQQDWLAAKRFLLSRVNDRGLLDHPETPSTYPVYATALFLGSLAELKDESDRTVMVQLGQGLKAQQCGSAAKALFQGGWGPGDFLPAERTESSPANISVTFFALEGLSRAGALRPEERDSALHFLKRCHLTGETQSLGGGFVFTPIEDHPLNKAGLFAATLAVKQAKPYLSATCDGISSLLVCGGAPTDPRIRAAFKALPDLPAPRLVQHPLNRDESVSQLDAIYFYTAAARARVSLELHERKIKNAFLETERLRGLKTLVDSQHSDGSWSNPLSWMREDDPLVATPLAVQALHRWLAVQPEGKP